MINLDWYIHFYIVYKGRYYTYESNIHVVSYSMKSREIPYVKLNVYTFNV